MLRKKYWTSIAILILQGEYSLKNEVVKFRDSGDVELFTRAMQEKFYAEDECPQEEGLYKSLGELRHYISKKFNITTVMARSYLSDAEKENFSICIQDGYLKNVNTHPLSQYLSACTKFTTEEQDWGHYTNKVWIFTFKKEKCSEILQGMKLLALGDEAQDIPTLEEMGKMTFC